MRIERFSFTEFEKQLEGIEFDHDKIEFISSEIVRCRNAIQDVKCEAKKIEPAEIKLTAKTSNQDTSLIELVNIDKKVKRAAILQVINVCAEKLCEEYFDYLERAEPLLVHHKTKLEARANWTECSRNGTIGSNEIDLTERITWLLRKEKLLKLFEIFDEKEMIANCLKEEFLMHFADEKKVPLCNSNNNYQKIQWLKSDNSFAILVKQMAKRGMVESKNIDHIFTKHFKNKHNREFKDLAQKRYNTKYFTNTRKWICKILDMLIVVLIFQSILV